MHLGVGHYLATAEAANAGQAYAATQGSTLQKTPKTTGVEGPVLPPQRQPVHMAGADPARRSVGCIRVPAKVHTSRH